VVERRRAVRYPCGLGTSRQLVAKVKLDSGEKIPAELRNISATGLSLILDQPLEPGSVVTVQLIRLGRAWHGDLEVRVVYCLRHPHGELIVGGAFAKDLSDAQVSGLL
jgi:hypothetical protein